MPHDPPISFSLIWLPTKVWSKFHSIFWYCVPYVQWKRQNCHEMNTKINFCTCCTRPNDAANDRQHKIYSLSEQRGTEWDKTKPGWRNEHKKDLKIYAVQLIVLWLDGCVKHITEMRNARKTLVAKSQGMRCLGGHIKNMEDKMDVNRQVQVSVRWRAFVTMLMTIWLHKNREIVDQLTDYSFIKKDLHHALLRGVTFHLWNT